MSGRELRVTNDVSKIINQEGDRGPIPQQLNEAIELISSANQRIEDCAVEWQAKISQAQWRILDKKPAHNKSWEESVLARTYFSDKKLDDAFQTLLRHNKTFTDHLQNFVAMAKGEEPTIVATTTRNAQNQSSDCGAINEEQILPSSSRSIALEKITNTNEIINSGDLLTKARKSFTNLIKAKIDFDTKFLGFEATLNGNSCATSSDPTLSLCQDCSRVLSCGKQVKSSKSPAPQKPTVQHYTRRSRRLKQRRLNIRKYALRNKNTNLVERTIEESTASDIAL